MVAFHQALGTGPRDSWRRRSKRNPLKPSGAREFGFLQSQALEALGPAFLPVKVTSCQSAFLYFIESLLALWDNQPLLKTR